MKKQTKFESLNNYLDFLKKHNPELRKLQFQHADGRLGRKIALIKVLENGGILTLTDFYTYTEMQIFLRGYQSKSEKLLKIN